MVMSRLINPIAEMEFSLISNLGKKLPLDAGSLIEFLKRFFDRSAGLSVAVIQSIEIRSEPNPRTTDLRRNA